MRSHVVTTGADDYWFLWIPQCALLMPGADARKPLPQAVPEAKTQGIDAWVSLGLGTSMALKTVLPAPLALCFRERGCYTTTLLLTLHHPVRVSLV